MPKYIFFFALISIAFSNSSPANNNFISYNDYEYNDDFKNLLNSSKRKQKTVRSNKKLFIGIIAIAVTAIVAGYLIYKKYEGDECAPTLEEMNKKAKMEYKKRSAGRENWPKKYMSYNEAIVHFNDYSHPGEKMIPYYVAFPDWQGDGKMMDGLTYVKSWTVKDIIISGTKYTPVLMPKNQTDKVVRLVGDDKSTIAYARHYLIKDRRVKLDIVFERQ